MAVLAAVAVQEMRAAPGLALAVQALQAVVAVWSLQTAGAVAALRARRVARAVALPLASAAVGLAALWSLAVVASL